MMLVRIRIIILINLRMFVQQAANLFEERHARVPHVELAGVVCRDAFLFGVSCQELLERFMFALNAALLHPITVQRVQMLLAVVAAAA